MDLSLRRPGGDDNQYLSNAIVMRNSTTHPSSRIAVGRRGRLLEARLLAETKAMVDRMRVCEPQQTSVYGQSVFNVDITRASRIGTECGGPGMCAVDPGRRRNIASPQTTNAAGAVRPGVVDPRPRRLSPAGYRDSGASMTSPVTQLTQ